MKMCVGCCNELPRESFSEEHWQLKQHQRRCKPCSDADRVVQPKSSLKTDSTEFQIKSEYAELQRQRQPPACATNDDGASCWICLEAGVDESRHTLRRDCSCRGKSGFVHLSCIAEYAGRKSEQWNVQSLIENDVEFADPWKVCQNCNQVYVGEFAVELARECVAFVEEKYNGDPNRLFFALCLKLDALLRMILNDPQSRQEQAAKRIGNKIFSVTRRMKLANPSLLEDIKTFEARAHTSLGNLHMLEERLAEAIEHFEASIDISQENGDIPGAKFAEMSISRAKSWNKGCTNIIFKADEVKKTREFCEHSTRVNGKGSVDAMESELHLGLALKDARRSIEAERLFTKLARLSRQIHGPDHELTKMCSSLLKNVQEREVVVGHLHEWKRFQALRHEEDSGRYAVRGPLESPRNLQEEETFFVVADEVVPTFGTPVVCRGLTNSPHLNGKIGDVCSLDDRNESFRVHFEDKSLEPCLIGLNNLRILFDLPEE